MKAKSFKKFLSIYSTFTIGLIVFTIFIVVNGGNLLSDFFNSKWIAIIAVGILMTVFDTLVVLWLNDRLYEAYQEKLRDDALAMTEALRKNKLGNIEQIDELTKELRDAGIIK